MLNSLVCTDSPPIAAARPVAVFEASRLEQVFALCFEARWQTRLIGGASEPYYQPAAASHDCHRLYYRGDYFASALHEVAHWCIAGERRRQLPDFGYWYAPDGRSAEQQIAFEKVESKPQALEWIFSQACCHGFHVSVDNLGAQVGATADTGAFKRQVLARAMSWQRRGLPPRAGIFFEALALEFGTGLVLENLDLNLSGIAG